MFQNKKPSVIKITYLKQDSFSKLTGFIGACFGFSFSLIMFIYSLFGGEAFINLGFAQLTGAPAALVSIVTTPALFFIIFYLFSIIAYLPFKYFLKKIRPLTLKGHWQ